MTEKEKQAAGVTGWTKDYTAEEEEQAYTLSMAMNAQGWKLDKVAALQLIETFEVVVAKKMEFSLKDAAKLEAEFESIRNEQTESGKATA